MNYTKNYNKLIRSLTDNTSKAILGAGLGLMAFFLKPVFMIGLLTSGLLGVKAIKENKLKDDESIVSNVIAHQTELVTAQINREIAIAKDKYINKPLENIRLAMQAGYKTALGIMLIVGCALFVASFFIPALPPAYIAIKLGILLGTAAVFLRLTSESSKKIDRVVDAIYYPIALLEKAKKFVASKFRAEKILQQKPISQPTQAIIVRRNIQPVMPSVEYFIARNFPILYLAVDKRNKAKSQLGQGLAGFVPQSYNGLKNL